MKRMMRLTILLVIALMVVVGCSNKNDNDNNDNGNENDNANEETDNDNNGDGDQVLQLGETGTMNTTAGKYEVTPTSFVAVDEWEGEKPTIDGDVYVIIDITVKNIGKSTLEGEDIGKVDAIGGEDLVSPNNALFNIINQLEGEIKPGEEMEGQLAFSLIPTDTYQLVFGMHKGTVSNKITWELHADDASESN